ncbi:hypothetical protein CN918_32420 [Priestia megaterium]|nr:hypothetical protein CN918_32420 [Priestia megaterium]
MTITNLDSYKTNKNRQASANLVSDGLPVSQKFCMISGFIMSNAHLFNEISYKTSPDQNHMAFYLSTNTLLGNVEIQIIDMNRLVVYFRKAGFDGSKDHKQLLFVDDPSNEQNQEEYIFQDVEKAIETLFDIFNLDKKSISLV